MRELASRYCHTGNTNIEQNQANHEGIKAGVSGRSHKLRLLLSLERRMCRLLQTIECAQECTDRFWCCAESGLFAHAETAWWWHSRAIQRRRN